MGVHRAQRVIQQVNVLVGIDGASQANALLLPARQIDALLADLGRVAARHDVEVDDQGAGVDDLGVELVVVVAAEEDVLARRLVLDPGLLGHVGCAPVQVQRAVVELLHLAQEA